MIELSHPARALLARARDGLGPTAADLARGRARLLAATVVVVPPAAVAPPPPATAAATAPRSVVATALQGAVIGLGVIGAVAAIGVMRRPDREVTRPSPSSAPLVHTTTPDHVAPVVVPLPRPPEVSAETASAEAVGSPPSRPRRRAHVGTAAPEPSEAEPTPAVAPQPADATSPPHDALARELAILRLAREALRVGDGDAALLAVDAYDREFARGQLIEEAAALRVETLCMLHRDDAAAALAAFAIASPHSAHRARVERACAYLEDSHDP